MPKITIPANGWRPRKYQMPAWGAWERGIKRHLLVWPRRAGKDEMVLHWTCVSAHLRVANYWHCLPQFEQARKVVWEAVNPHTGKKRIDEAFPHILRNATRNDNMTIEFKTGATWRLVGSDNPDSLVGAPPVGIGFSEWALSNPSVWPLLAPILGENNGWAAFVTTPRGRNHVKAMVDEHRKDKDWFTQVLTVDDTAHIKLEQIDKDRRTYIAMFGAEAAEALIQQEYWCSFEAAILGAYYGKELAIAEQAGRIRKVEHEDALPVHTAWDLGVDDAMAIWWFQPVAGQIRVLDYHEGHGYGIHHYAELVKRTALERGYLRGTDYVPHDAKQREMTSSGHDGRAKQRLEVMVECGLKPRVIASHSLIDGVSAARQILSRCWWDEEKTAEGLNALRSYQTEWDDDAKVFKKTPLHNWASHGADAFRYLAMAYREIRAQPQPEPGRMLTVGGEANLPVGVKGATLNDLWALQPRHQSRRI